MFFHRRFYMADMSKYWELWSPYWTYIEENFLDSDSIQKLTPFVKAPVLIVGGGQGLLVEKLQQNGFHVDGVDSESLMIEFAEKRRGIKLIEADGANLPFDDDTYNTCIVATGVIDFLEDESKIKSILDEALRVTSDDGNVFVASCRFHPKVEKLMRYIGLLTDQDIWCYRRTLDIMRLSFLEQFSIIRNDPNVSTFGAFLTLLQTQMFLPNKENRSAKNWKKAWKKAKQELDDPEMLLQICPESAPYRNEMKIKDLYKRLNFTLTRTLVFHSCTVVQLTKQGMAL